MYLCIYAYRLSIVSAADGRPRIRAWNSHLEKELSHLSGTWTKQSLQQVVQSHGKMLTIGNHSLKKGVLHNNN